MCEIQTIMELDGKNVAVCTYHAGDFMRAKSINLYDKTGGVAKITKFAMAETKQCFNSNPVSPIFRVEEEVESRFLQRGNKVVIEIDD